MKIDVDIQTEVSESFLGKDELDQIKRPKSGGGKPVQLTSAEDLFLLGMEGRPQKEGLPFGVDTDGTVEYFTSVIKNMSYNRAHVSY